MMSSIASLRKKSLYNVGVIAVIALSAAAASEELPKEATEQWEPVPAVVSAPAGQPPADAIVLFSGTSLDAWRSMNGGPAGWSVNDGSATAVPNSGHIQTVKAFGDVQLQLEFRTPQPPKGKGQQRGNSGIFFMGRYELQILDSFENPTYVNGQAGSVYKQHPPLVNASRPPGEWQSYDVVFIAPRFHPDGSLRSPARMTVFHNGVLVQYDVALAGRTRSRGLPSYTAHDTALPLHLQDHKSPVSFRNIWIREL
jgi:hypothetical protein